MTIVAVEEFLGAFFGPGNDLMLPPVWRQSPHFRQFLPFIEDLEEGERRPLLLPREHNGVSMLYACGWDAAQRRRLAESVRAFIGPTWSDFDGILVKARPSDPVEQALSSLGVEPFFRLRIDGRRRADAWHATGLLRHVWLATPDRTWEEQVPVGRMLRDFDMALAAHDENLSAHLLEKIEQSRELQPANVAFLKIRRLRALEDAQGILKLPGLDDLLDLRLPLAVRDAVLAAGQTVYLKEHRDAGDVAGAVAAAHGHLGVMRRLLDDVRLPPSEAAVDALLTLMAAEVGEGRPRLVPEGLRGDVSDWQRSLLAELRPPEGPRGGQGSDATAVVQAALEDGRAAEAWVALDHIPNTQARLQLAVQCALSLNDAAVTRQVAEELQAVDAVMRRAVLSPPWFGDVWRNHLATTAPSAIAQGPGSPVRPTTWPEFLRSLLDGTVEDAQAVVEDQAISWPAVGHADRDVDTLLVQFDPSDAPFEELTRVLPRLLESITDEEPAPRTAATCVTLIALNEEMTPPAVRALLEALRLAVASGPTDYGELLELIASVLPRALAVPTTDWFLDLVDYLQAAPAASDEARQAFCTQVLTRIHVFARRLDPPQRLLAGLLSRDVGLVLDWAPDEDVATASGPAVLTVGGTVLLYSLQTAVLARVKEALHGLSDKVTVHTSEDHDGSPRLKSQAQTSDVLVLATRRATHAATGFIERWRRPDSLLVYAPGAGSASMLTSALAALRGD